MSRLQRQNYSATGSVRSNLYDSSSSDDEDDLVALREEEEEEEQERLLSEQHGEASESAGKKRGAETDADIAQALISSDAAAATLRRTKARPTLSEQALMGPHGLLRIRRELSSKIKYRAPSRKALSQAGSNAKRLDLEINAAAVYSAQLIGSYQRFCTDLMPTWHYVDTLRKVEDLGSKKSIRLFIQNMRDEVCRENLTRVCGKEKADRLLNELEHGLKTDVHGDFDGYRSEGSTGSRNQAMLESHPTEEQELELIDTAGTLTASTVDHRRVVVPGHNPYGKRPLAEWLMPSDANARQGTDRDAKGEEAIERQADLNESDQDEEASFDDVLLASSGAPVTPLASIPSIFHQDGSGHQGPLPFPGYSGFCPDFYMAGPVTTVRQRPGRDGER